MAALPLRLHAAMAALVLLLLAVSPAATSALAPEPCANHRISVSGSVELRDGQWQFVNGGQGGIAQGSYVDGASTASNFGQLVVNTSEAYRDEEQMFAAGYLEGVLTAPRIFDNFNNMHAYFTKTMNVSLKEPMKWIEDQDCWVRGQCRRRHLYSGPSSLGLDAPSGDASEAYSSSASDNGDDVSIIPESEVSKAGGPESEVSKAGDKESKGRRYWRSVCLLLAQFDGMVAGYQAHFEAQQGLGPEAGASGTAAAGVIAGEAAGGADRGAGSNGRHGEGAGAEAQANRGAAGKMTYWDFLFVSGNADLYDVIDMLDPSQGPTWAVQSGASPTSSTFGAERARRHAAFLEEARRDPQQAAAKLFSDVALSGKCSALVKLSADLSDILMGHSTWDTYTAALRVFKHYHFHLKGLKPAARRVSFSSYPGELFSDDDFYLMDSKLVVLQTTNKIFNDELFEALTPHSVLSWQRVRTANWLASSGKEWAELLKKRNSGTYNNQYMVVDLKKFKPKSDVQDGLLWVVEQIPGLVVDADMTASLVLGYWPSFNVPFFPEIYNQSGYPDFVSKVEKYGQHFDKTTHWLSYQQSPRAKIFRRDQSKVSDLAGMKAIMRYNDWRNDPFSEGNPICAVCGRGDLDPDAPIPRGCYDSKVTNYEMALNMEAEAVNGPTTDQGQLPPFDWKRQFPDTLHRGMPRRFVFEFERMSASAVRSVSESQCLLKAGAEAGEGGLHVQQ